ncbi:cytochrome b5 [Pleurotus eryngii]|uniref:Cytochrome b5 n=1 Tax=Pleurotus eryngii TaxID=5323 RepID=A0A9P5ZJN6_PLEER|nr:cytochrome b5 [Pleurotus eryngii]
MSSYLRSWLGTGIPAARPSPPTQDDIPVISRSSPPPPDEEDDGEATETEDNSPPLFPSPYSAQRASSGVPRIITDTQLMPPPPPPQLASRTPGVSSNSSSLSAPSTLAVPYTTTKPPAKLNTKKKGKVALAPGHSPLDWANLKASGEDLRGVDTLMRIPPSVLKQHNKRDDAWTAINGKVYNMTAYLPFHPGGEKELMRVAGRDGTKLFASTHAWVNADFMLDACLVGFLIPEPST